MTLTPAIGEAPHVRLRAVRDDDWPLLRRWLARPDMERWWGPKASSEAAVILAMCSSHALCRIIEVANPDARSNTECDVVGYAHAVDATLWGETLPDDLERGTWDIDLFIASAQHRNAGIGQRALMLLRDEVFDTTLAIAVCIFASIANERAVRAYEKAGFRWKQVWNDPAVGPSWFMLCERPPTALTPKLL